MRMRRFKKLPEGAITHFEFGYEQIGYITLKNQLIKVEWGIGGPDVPREYGDLEAAVFRKKDS